MKPLCQYILLERNSLAAGRPFCTTWKMTRGRSWRYRVIRTFFKPAIFKDHPHTTKLFQSFNCTVSLPLPQLSNSTYATTLTYLGIIGILRPILQLSTCYTAPTWSTEHWEWVYQIVGLSVHTWVWLFHHLTNTAIRDSLFRRIICKSVILSVLAKKTRITKWRSHHLENTD